MIDLWHPAPYAIDGSARMRVVPKLTIDKILLLSVLLSCVYIFLYGTMTSSENAHKHVHPSEKKQRDAAVLPGAAFSSSVEPNLDEAKVQDLKTSLRENVLDFPVRKPPQTVKYPEIIGYSGAVKTCASETRLDHLRDSCKTSPAKDYDYDQADKQALRYVVVDHDRKLLYCLIGKAGSKSWLQYMVDSKNTDKKGHLRHNTFLETVGLEMLRNVALEKVNNQYKDYFKFLVVRHPLQRAVSAFYETVVLHEKYRNKRGALLNFTEFAEGVTGDLMDENPHWRRYINRCKVCKVDYEYIIKTETMDDDISDFNDVIGNREDHTVAYTHQNKFIGEGREESVSNDVHHYKYDKILYTLQRKQPDLMKKLINVYAEDMQLFGYKWDWSRGKSSCGISERDEECC